MAEKIPFACRVCRIQYGATLPPDDCPGTCEYMSCSRRWYRE